METFLRFSRESKASPFNFLASLINGNRSLESVQIASSQPFNFLASLINGNKAAVGSTSPGFLVGLLTS